MVLLVSDMPRAGAFFAALGLPVRASNGSLLVDSVTPPLALSQGPPLPVEPTASVVLRVGNLMELVPRLLHECGAELVGALEFEPAGAVATVRCGNHLFTLVEKAEEQPELT